MSESSQQLDQLNKELQVAREQATKERQELENRLKKDTSETQRLQELCQKYHTELTARQVDLSIAESALNE